MKRTLLCGAVLASSLCLAGYPTASPAEGVYGHFQVGPPVNSYGPSSPGGIGYRLSGQNQYNLNISRNTLDSRRQADRPHQRGAYGYPYGHYRGYGDDGYGRYYRHGYSHGYRDNYRDTWRYGGSLYFHLR
ncbi:MAG: hypothetical protein P8126_03170 [Gammaproteobacteria bacterium]|jgi:hypothetical protein